MLESAFVFSHCFVSTSHELMGYTHGSLHKLKASSPQTYSDDERCSGPRRHGREVVNVNWIGPQSELLLLEAMYQHSSTYCIILKEALSWVRRKTKCRRFGGTVGYTPTLTGTTTDTAACDHQPLPSKYRSTTLVRHELAQQLGWQAE